MRTIFVYLVAVTVALHALLGCCWHHAHEAAVSVEPSETECFTLGEQCGCHHDATPELADHDESHPAHHEPSEPFHESCGDRCVYVSADRVQVDHPLLVVSFGLLPEVRQAAESVSFSTARFEATNATADPPPLRIHLLHQLLLI